MLIIALEGGLVSSISTDNDELRALLNNEGVAVIDYDTEGADKDEIISVKSRNAANEVVEFEAVGRIEEVEPTSINVANLHYQLGM